MLVTVIEDSTDTVKLVAQALGIRGEKFGIQAIVTAPFFDAEIEKDIAGFKPDLIILDLLLDHTTASGFHVLRQIKDSKLLHMIPVLICSSHIIDSAHGNKLRNKAIDIGAADAVYKSLRPEELSPVLERILRANVEKNVNESP